MINKWKKFKSYLTHNIAGGPGGGGGGGYTGNPVADFFRWVGVKVVEYFMSKPIEATFRVIMGVSAFKQYKAMEALKKQGQELLLTKYGTGGGIPVLYGLRRVGGTVVFMDTAKAQKELFVVYVFCDGESEQITDLQIDNRDINDLSVFRDGYLLKSDNDSNLYGSGASYSPSNPSAEIANVLGGSGGDNPRMVFNLHHGADDQTADPMLTGVFDGTNADTVWSSNHRLRGLTYIATNYEFDTRGMFQGIPNLTATIKGRKIYDPRLDSTQTGGSGSHRSDDDSTWAWSNNPALCLLDYLTNDKYGKGLSYDQIDIASFMDSADDCDEDEETINHGSSVVVNNASTTSDRIILDSESIFNAIKIGQSITFTVGATTYFSGQVIAKRSPNINEEDESYQTDLFVVELEPGSVTTAITTATTGSLTESQKRFECNAVIDTDKTVLENAQDLIRNMRGIFTYTNGKYHLKVEGSETPVVTLDEDDIIDSGIELSMENKETKFNRVEVEFYNANKKYEADTVVVEHEPASPNQDDHTFDDNGENLETRAVFPFVTNQRIAYNHAYGILKRSRAQKSVSFVATPKVMKAKVGEVISITNSNMDLSAEQYRITQMQIQPDLNVKVSAVEYQGTIYGWQSAPDEDIKKPRGPVDPYLVSAPTGINFTQKNGSAPAFLSWTNPDTYPNYQFRVKVYDQANQAGNVVREGIVQETRFELPELKKANGYSAEVSSINTLNIESEPGVLNTFNVTVDPVGNSDIGSGAVDTDEINQGAIGGFSFTASKMYHPVDGSDTGVFETSNVYIDDSGQFSLKDKLSFDGTTLDISGNLTVENTISADKILLDGNNLADLFESGDSGSDATLTTNSKIQRFNWIDGLNTTHYGLYIDNTGTYGEIGVGTVSQPSDAIHVRNSGARLRLETPSTGYVRVKGSGTSMELEAGNTGAGYDNTSYILMDIAGNDVAKFHALGGMELPSLTPTTTTNRLYNNAGTLFWNGNQVGVGAINSVTNMADNRVLTASGANSANGEANLTFDGSTLALTGSQTISSNLTVSGNLTVNGTTTTLNTATLDVEDKNITLNYSTGDSSASANGAGITIQDAVNSTTDATILWNSGTDEFDFSHGITLPDDQMLEFGDSQDLQIFHDSSDSYIQNATGNIEIRNNTNDGDINFRSDNGSGGLTTYFAIDGGGVYNRFYKNAYFTDNVKALFGNSSDLQIYHDGSNSYIKDAGTGNLRVDATNFYVRNSAGTELKIGAIDDGAVDLYYDGSKKFATTSTGIDVTGTAVVDGLTNSGSTSFFADVVFELSGASITVDYSADKMKFDDSIKATFGNGDDLQIYHDGSNSYIKDAGTGTLRILSDDVRIMNSAGTEISAQFLQDGEARLKYDNVTKLATTSSGIDVTGTTSSGQLTVTTSSADLAVFRDNTDHDVGIILEKNPTSDFALMRLNGTNGDGRYIIGYGSTHSNTANQIAIKNLVNNGQFYYQNNDGGIIWTTGNQGFNLKVGSYEINGVDVITSARNLENIGTISSGKIGVGANTASYWSQANSLVLDDSGNTGLSIKSATSGNGRVVFTDTTSTTAGLNDGGQIHYGHTNDEMKIRTAGTDALTIDSSQNATFAGDITANSGYIYIAGSSASEGGELSLNRGTSGSSDIKLDNYQDDFRVHADGSVRFQHNGSDGLDVKTGGYLVNGTTVIDSSRNLTNIGTISSKDITITQNSDTATNLTLKRNSATGRSQFALANESGTQLWRVGLTGAGGEDFVFYDGGANVLILDRSSNSANFAGNIQIGGTTVIDSSRNIKAVDVNLSGSIQNTTVPAEASVKINEKGYNDGTTYYRDLDIFDGKGNQFVKFDGSTQRVGIGTTAISTALQVGDGTTAQTVRVKYNDNTHTNIHGWGMELDRSTSYIRPSGNNSKTLHFGYTNKNWNYLNIYYNNYTRWLKGSTEYMRLDSSGRLGVGTTSAGEKLQVNGNFKLEESAPIMICRSTNNASGLRISVDNNVGSTANIVRFQYQYATKHTFFANGNATFTGTLTENSDAKFKDNITPLGSQLAIVNQLNPVEYDRNDIEDTHEIGFIAQEVEKLIPDVVMTDKEGTKSLSYGRLVATLTKAIQEQQEQINGLTARIKILENT